METDDHLWQVREYDAASDAPMLHEWAKAHGSAFVEAWLPPVGVVACCDGEARAALWLYMCVGVGVGFIEHAYTAPSLTITDAKTATRHCVESLRAVAREHNTGLLFAHTSAPIAGVLSDMVHCHRANDRLVQLVIPTSP